MPGRYFILAFSANSCIASSICSARAEHSVTRYENLLHLAEENRKSRLEVAIV